MSNLPISYPFCRRSNSRCGAPSCATTTLPSAQTIVSYFSLRTLVGLCTNTQFESAFDASHGKPGYEVGLKRFVIGKGVPSPILKHS
jgi:hypothetical protein